MCVLTGKAAARFSLKVSGDGMRVLLVALTGHVFLWECMDVRDLAGVRDGTVRGHWAHIQPLEDTALPSSQDKEASQHTVFVKTEVCTCNKNTYVICCVMFSGTIFFFTISYFVHAFDLVICFSLRLWVMPAFQPLCSHQGRS